MTITLPLDAQRWPIFRLLTRASFGSAASGGASGDGWQIHAMQNNRPDNSGLILLSYSRCLLPQTGTARLVYRFGRFLGRIAGASSGSPAQGQQWNPAVDTMNNIPDFRGLEVRLQAAPGPLDRDHISSAAWVTVFWGTCEFQTDDGWGGADVPSGERTYHCVDALYRLKRWNLDRHGLYSNGTAIANAYGNPGYNVAPGAPSQLSGNRESTGTTFTTQSGVAAFNHCRPGAGTAWTDVQAINHALATSRPPGEPLFVLSGATDLYDDASSIEIPDGAKAFEFLTSICDRGRGRGAVALGWTETGTEGPITPLLVSRAQLYGSYSYVAPVGGAQNVFGALANGTTVDVDLIGDHRLVPGSLVMGDAEQYRVDYLESLGERIQVLATVSYTDGTLEPGWNASSKAAFNAITDPTKRKDEKWAPVYQLHRLSRSFDFTTKNGSGVAGSRCDFQCNDAGLIYAGLTPTSILTAKVMDDLPLYEGYVYDAVVARQDGDANTAFAGTPARRDPLIWASTSTTAYTPIGGMTMPMRMKVLPDGFLIEVNNNQETGLRYFADSAATVAQRQYDYTQLGLTIGLELPHRIRMATGDPTGRRRLSLVHPDLHLWVAHQGAVWDYDSTNGSGAASPPKRACAASVNGILRDDRDALAKLHFLAVAWYGPIGPAGITDGRRSSQWSLRCCGDIPTEASYDGGTVIYPAVGKVVHKLMANGQAMYPNSPVSSFIYDNEAGVSTWVTDWQELDFKR